MVQSSDVQELIEKALAGELVELGEYAARDDDSGFVTTYPKMAAESNSVDASTEFKVWLDQETGAVVTVPADG